MNNSAGATQAAFETMDRGLSATFDRLKAQLSVMAIETGEKEIPESEVPETVPVATDRTARNERAQQMNEDHAERAAKKAMRQGGPRKRRNLKR